VFLISSGLIIQVWKLAGVDNLGRLQSGKNQRLSLISVKLVSYSRFIVNLVAGQDAIGDSAAFCA
jgi:hypothetical protein